MKTTLLKTFVYTVEVLVLFVPTSFSIHSHLAQEFKQKNNDTIIKIEKFQLRFITCFDTTNHSHVLVLFN